MKKVIEATANELKRLAEEEDFNCEKVIALLQTAKPCKHEVAEKEYQKILPKYLSKTLDYDAFVSEFLSK